MSKVKLNPEYEAHLKRFASIDPKTVTSFNCPACKAKLMTLKPMSNNGANYDSFSSCPNCEEIFYKTVNYYGTVKASIPEGRK